MAKPEKTEKKPETPIDQPKAEPKKASGIITRKFYLDSDEGEVEVTVRGPRGAVRLASSETHVFVVAGDAQLPTGTNVLPASAGQSSIAAGPITNRTLDAAGEEKFRQLQKSERERVEAEKKKRNPNAEIWDNLLGEEGAGKQIMNHLEAHGTPDA